MNRPETAAVPIRKIGKRVEYSDHVRVASYWDHRALRTYQAICWSCSVGEHRPFVVGPDRKYFGVATRDAVAHTHAEHDGR